MKFHTIVESRSFGSNDPMEPTGGGYGYVLYTDAFRHSKDGVISLACDRFGFALKLLISCPTLQCRIRWNAELFQIIASKDYSPGEEVPGYFTVHAWTVTIFI